MLHFPAWKTYLILGICLFGVLFALPNLLPRETANALPDWLPHKQINLGLDLRGGSHLLLEVDVGSVVRERLTSLIDEARVALRGARINYKGLGVSGESIVVTIPKAGEQAEARRLLAAIDRDITVSVDEQGRLVMKLSKAALKTMRDSAVNQSLEIVRRRIDESGTREPTIQRQGEDRILVQLPGIDDPDRIKQLLGKTAKLAFRLVDPNTSVAEALAGHLPAGSELLNSDSERDANGRPIQYVVRKRVMVSGDNLIDAQPSFQNGEPVVSFRFDPVGARKFGEVTTKNVGRPFAIVLDNKVISAPVIREPITGGRGVISGRFTVQEATDLALLLRAGALPAPLTILAERSVGPDLGADSIRAGEVAAVLGIVFVVAFMAICYGLFGLAADLALFINLILIVAALSILQATLTLPGIAGIVLTIGMAVDANVLIFERIREEVRLGRTPISAIEAGYTRAIKTIIDANVTTLIAAILLYQFGSGPVRGFAVTLGIGIAASMFTAVMLTRLMVVAWLRRSRPQTLSI